MNETLDLINNRKSIRKFNDKKISEKELNHIIKAGLRAPTAGNMMLYSIIKIKNKSTLKKLSKTCDNQKFIKTADTALIFVADYRKWKRYFKLNGINVKNQSYGNLMLGINDALIAAQNTVIAAESLGIGSCYIGDIMENYEKQSEILGLPEGVFLATMLVFGKYDFNPPITDRFDAKYVVFNEKYRDLDDKEIMSMFAKKEKNMDSKKYAEKFYNRKINSAFFEEMNRSIELAIKNWLKN